MPGHSSPRRCSAHGVPAAASSGSPRKWIGALAWCRPPRGEDLTAGFWHRRPGGRPVPGRIHPNISIDTAEPPGFRPGGRVNGGRVVVPGIVIAVAGGLVARHG